MPDYQILHYTMKGNHMKKTSDFFRKTYIHLGVQQKYMEREVLTIEGSSLDVNLRQFRILA
jgi:hypothetical protein